MKHGAVLAAWLLAFVAMNAHPEVAWAQETALSGAVTDSTGAVLPGVTVTATHTDSGNTFVAVTDGRGEFRLALRTGTFRITTELPGFATAQYTLELLVGQQAVLNIQMKPSTLQESVTVTAEAPLIDVTDSALGSNIDPRQMQQLPVNGRNWQDLALLAPGSRSNANNDAPVDRSAANSGGAFQLNIDGQQVTQLIVLGGGFGQPKFSRDAIAEFEFVANRFDATQGRSTGVQVNAVTKSGSNIPSGTFASYFRNDRFNAPDHVVHRVLPYSDTQISGTFGGPIRKDRMHFFANVEIEREPQTFTYTTPYPKFNFDQKGTRREHTGGVRFDAQFSPQTHFSVRANTWQNFFPYGGGSAALSSSTTTPSAPIRTVRWMNEQLATLTSVLSGQSVNELKVGFARYGWDFSSVVHMTWPSNVKGPADARVNYGSPRVFVRGLLIGQNQQFTPQVYHQDTYSVRDTLTHSFTMHGHHDMKFGGEFMYLPIWQFFCNFCFGILNADVAPRPANLEDLFPNLLDADTWNLAALSPITYRWQQGFGNMVFKNPRSQMAGWLQDDWAVAPRLTLNLGARYDLSLRAYNNKLGILPWLNTNRPEDKNNVAPRLGAVFNLNPRTTVRGGFGMFYGEAANPHFITAYNQQVVADVASDGRADFAANPYNGPLPTYEQVLARVCTPAAPFAAGCIRRGLSNGVPSNNAVIPFSYQTSIGAQRQFGSTMAITADYVYTGGHSEAASRSVNLSYNPATGVNYPFTDITHRSHPDWGAVIQTFNEGRSNSHALQTSFTKRFSQGWQLSANYTLAAVWDASTPTFLGVPEPPDLGGEYTLAVTDQRHRAVVNGVWEIAHGLQFSGLYFFGSGERLATSWGPDLRDLGGASENRLRPTGTIVPRNNLVGSPIHRVDLRLQQRLPVVGRAKLEGVLETFNVFDHANFGSYTTQESNPAYGQPTVNQNVAYVPRTLQLGFRLSF
jgi:hypothetical protein